MINCTSPKCNCLKEAEREAGGPVKSYQCLAPVKESDKLKPITINDILALKESIGPPPDVNLFNAKLIANEFIPDDLIIMSPKMLEYFKTIFKKL